jgi:hypothetical protein
MFVGWCNCSEVSIYLCNVCSNSDHVQCKSEMVIFYKITRVFVHGRQLLNMGLFIIRGRT